MGSSLTQIRGKASRKPDSVYVSARFPQLEHQQTKAQVEIYLTRT